MPILVLNAGSSSLRFALYAAGPSGPQIEIKGTIHGIGTSSVTLFVESSEGKLTESLGATLDHRAALHCAIGEIEQRQDKNVTAIGHRIVHGGTWFREPVVIDSRVLEALRSLIPLAPLHQPVEVDLIDAARERFEAVPHVACFDTAIHHTLPEVAARLPLPRWLWDAGIRRYGFHGLSYESVLLRNPEFRQGKTVIAHLGNGVSATAFQNGVSVDTTMGFTPTGGLMMGTRCGDIDPGVMIHLLREYHLSHDDLDRMANHESGLKAVSGTTSDMRVLLDSVHDDAKLAVEMFCYIAAKHIGGLSAALEGMDRLVFTGGIGEHAVSVRSLICHRLGYLGLRLDNFRNDANAFIISEMDSPCTVHVAKTDEESLIATRTLELINLSAEFR